MNQERYERFCTKLKMFESPHIKVDKIELDKETGNITVDIIQTPRGLKFTLSEDFDGTPEDMANLCLRKANGMIRDMACKDLKVWMAENARHLNSAWMRC